MWCAACTPTLTEHRVADPLSAPVRRLLVDARTRRWASSVEGRAASLAASAVILATGGAVLSLSPAPPAMAIAWPRRWAIVMPPRPALVPAGDQRAVGRDLQGLSLRNVRASL